MLSRMIARPGGWRPSGGVSQHAASADCQCRQQCPGPPPREASGVSSAILGRPGPTTSAKQPLLGAEVPAVRRGSTLAAAGDSRGPRPRASPRSGELLPGRMQDGRLVAAASGARGTGGGVVVWLMTRQGLLPRRACMVHSRGHLCPQSWTYGCGLSTPQSAQEGFHAYFEWRGGARHHPPRPTPSPHRGRRERVVSCGPETSSTTQGIHASAKAGHRGLSPSAPSAAACSPER